MTTATLYNNNWMGEKVSEYGTENGWIDYKCLSSVVGDMVLCNDITKLFYNYVAEEYTEPEQVNGEIDNSELIEAKQEQIETLENTLENAFDDEHINYLNNQIEIIQEQIEELEREQDGEKEIFQWYIISDNGADMLKRFTDEIVYYIPVLDIYIWGITHYGTSWEYVLTDIKIEEEQQ